VVHCHDATDGSFIAKVRVEVFAHSHTVAIKRRSSMRNWLFGMPGWILCEQSPWSQRKWWACSLLCSSPALPFSVLVSLHFLCTAHTFLTECLSIVTARVSGTLFQRFSQNLMLFLCHVHCKIASGQIHTTPNKMM
jgi:hypothetical protein